MKKDVIYIDTEDDITGVIGKIKAAEAKIIALVPPKRAGVLQSVVNLKLLQKAASAADKRFVIITNDNSLTALAAGLKIPIAKNLQSRPEVPKIQPPATEEEEIIDGQEISQNHPPASQDKSSAPSAADEISEKVEFATAPPAVPAGPSPLKKVMPAMGFGKKKGGLKVPNFDGFRKKFFLFAGIGVLFAVFLIWALVFAPHASVTITARTTAVNVNRGLELIPSLPQSDISKLQLKPNVQQVKKSVAAEFDATGSKEIGNPASGTINVTNCEYTQGFTLPSGTVFTAANGLQFKSTQAASMPGYTQQSKCDETKRGVPVQAVTFGPEYNLAAQPYNIASLDGDITAMGEVMNGGTKETVKIVSQEDVEKAKQQLAAQNPNEAKAELKKRFSEEEFTVIEESFIAENAEAKPSPAVGEQAARAKLTQETTFSIIGLKNDEIRQVLVAAVDEALKGKTDQQRYGLGDKTLSFELFQKQNDGSFTTNLTTTGYIGPKIDTNTLASQITGKRFGEIQAMVQAIEGVDKVDIQFSPFWVTTAPSPDKIEIKFSIANEQ